jgi:hypothetical protein
MVMGTEILISKARRLPYKVKMARLCALLIAREAQATHTGVSIFTAMKMQTLFWTV